MFRALCILCLSAGQDLAGAPAPLPRAPIRLRGPEVVGWWTMTRGSGMEGPAVFRANCSFQADLTLYDDCAWGAWRVEGDRLILLITGRGGEWTEPYVNELRVLRVDGPDRMRLGYRLSGFDYYVDMRRRLPPILRRPERPYRPKED